MRVGHLQMWHHLQMLGHLPTLVSARPAEVARVLVVGAGAGGGEAELETMLVGQREGFAAVAVGVGVGAVEAATQILTDLGAMRKAPTRQTREGMR